MEWRCEWCGKPHAEDDPPCENCGHGKFEKAVVQVQSGEAAEQTSLVWKCTECGREHPKNSPPCSRCGNAKLEKTRNRVDETNLTDGPNSETGGTRYEAETTKVWVCTDCGRESPRKNPPCSRCGGMEFDQQEKRVDAEELSTPSYFDVLTPAYAAGLVLVVGLVAVVGLGMAGVIDLPGMGPPDVPDVENVPGDDETANGIELAAVEEAYLAAINEYTQERGLATLERTELLDDLAEYHNQKLVKNQQNMGSEPDGEVIWDVIEHECSGDSGVFDAGIYPLIGDESPEDVGHALASRLTEGDHWPPDRPDEATGIDVHYHDGLIYLVHYVCVTE